MKRLTALARWPARSVVLAPWFIPLLVAILVPLAGPARLQGDETHAAAADLPIEIMSVDEVRPGMKGHGKTVLEGTQIVPFEATMLGVLRGVQAGRDMVLCRLSGAGLDYTGVIAGMSGSPIYIDGKLLGAVAYAWPFNKEPIAGITPFEQMRAHSQAPAPVEVAMATAADGTLPVEALLLDGEPLITARADTERGAKPVTTAAAEMAPIRMPLTASGFGPRTMALIEDRFAPLGLVPMAGGGGTTNDLNDLSPGAPVTDATDCRDKIVPGSPLALSLVMGDFDLSALGTTTHVEGDRVWGWGHPFMGHGKCQYLLRSSDIILVNPRQDLSTKIGAPGAVLGVVDADCSTCVAGTLGAELDMLPLGVSLCREPDGHEQKYHVEIVRHPALLGSLVAMVLSGAMEAGGAMQSEITIELDATIRAEGLEPIRFDNTYSSASEAGTQGLSRLLMQVATVADTLTRNPFNPVRIESIDCQVGVRSERTSAAITAVRLNSDHFEPGDTVVACATLRPFRGKPFDVTLSLDLPRTLKPGAYSATVCDATMHLKQVFAEEPHLLAARCVEDVADVYRLQLAERRQTLYLRVVEPESGLSVGDVQLPALPGSVRAAFSTKRATPGRPIRRAIVARQPTDWVIEGSSEIRFTVVDSKQVIQPSPTNQTAEAGA